jgi:glycosyltransferase involved in cell wall biosynthesis
LQWGLRETKITSIPYGTNLSKFKPAATPNSTFLRILYVGQISQLKGISYILEAFRRIKGASTRLTLMGNFISMGQSARVRAEHFSWEAYAHKAADLVLSLAGKPRHGARMPFTAMEGRRELAR